MNNTQVSQERLTKLMALIMQTQQDEISLLDVIIEGLRLSGEQVDSSYSGYILSEIAKGNNTDTLKVIKTNNNHEYYTVLKLLRVLASRNQAIIDPRNKTWMLWDKSSFISYKNNEATIVI